jgi:hypothetical protein
VLRENVIAVLHQRVAREPTFGIVTLRRLVSIEAVTFRGGARFPLQSGLMEGMPRVRAQLPIIRAQALPLP